VCGCIMLNAELTKIVLVRSWQGNSWSFPRGKINQSEAPLDCAVRETLEETGYNPRLLCNEADVIQVGDFARAGDL
jgi:mRNA-decapping enzyme subunit 2